MVRTNINQDYVILKAIKEISKEEGAIKGFVEKEILKQFDYENLSDYVLEASLKGSIKLDGSMKNLTKETKSDIKLKDIVKYVKEKTKGK